MSPKSDIHRSSLYFQTIARFFFEQRGAPFFLSARELEIVEEWEKSGIPLRTVLEGIRLAVEKRTKNMTEKKPSLSLVFCNRFVQNAFAAHKERRLGRRTAGAGAKSQAGLAITAIRKFLAHRPSHLQELGKIYVEALRLLNSPRLDEDRLETIEREAEKLMLRSAKGVEKEGVRQQVREQFPDAVGEELERILRIKLLKLLREKYGIPHVVPYYH